jgi:diguanylate cyclase (GGDEF)-like protein
MNFRSFSSRSWRWLQPWWPTFCGTLLILLLAQIGVSRYLEPVASDVLWHLRGARSWDSRIVLVNIDQASLDALGWFPWSRDRYVPLLDRLSQAAPNTVVFDLLFSEATADDAALAAAMVRHGQVVLGSAWNDANHLLLPTPQLQQAAMSVGHMMQAESGFDRQIVQIDLLRQQQPALALAAVQAQALGGGALPPIDLDQAFNLNWPGPIQRLPQYSLIDVIQGKISRDRLTDKIILIGLTATGFDTFGVGLDWLNSAHGVHIHAAAISNLLDQTNLRSLTPIGLSGLILGLGVMWGSLMRLLKFRVQWVAMFLVPIAWLFVCAITFRFNYYLPVMLPMLLFGVVSIGVLFQDRMNLDRVNQQLAQQVTIDALTQVKNRYFLESSMVRIWSRLLRDRGEIALILCDVDYFKLYNDRLGHPAGDRCLYQVAQTIQSCLKRPDDFVARYGGEEFVVVLPDTSRLGAERIAVLIQQELDQLGLSHPGLLQTGQVTLSLGVAWGKVTDVSADGLLYRADQALYEAKRLGRDRYCVAGDLPIDRQI